MFLEFFRSAIPSDPVIKIRSEVSGLLGGVQGNDDCASISRAVRMVAYASRVSGNSSKLSLGTLWSIERMKYSEYVAMVTVIGGECLEKS